jgi:hypothetical protein
VFKPLAALLILTAGVTIWWVEFGRYSPSERDLFGRVQAVIGDGKPTSLKIVREFGLSAECATKTCFFQPSKIGRVSYAGGNIRNPNGKVIFELDHLAGECISTSMAANWFGGAVAQSCVDSVCWYLESRRKWGVVAFGLDKRNSSCVSSVVINSAP